MSATFVYVLPLLGEEWLKLGISNDPLRRARQFSPRFFELFDFDAAFLVETDNRRDAGRIELSLRRALRIHRAAMPVAVRPEAGGKTEWLRGAYPALRDAARAFADEGYDVHTPARPWFTSALGKQRDELHAWASAALGERLIDPEHPAPEALPADLISLLADTVDAFHHFGWGVGDFLPPALQGWYGTLPHSQPTPGVGR